MTESLCLCPRQRARLLVSEPLRNLAVIRRPSTKAICLKFLSARTGDTSPLPPKPNCHSLRPAMKRNKDQLSLIGGTEDRTPPPVAIARDFDSARLTQARHLAGMTKKEVADAISVTAAAVGQY